MVIATIYWSFTMCQAGPGTLQTLSHLAPEIQTMLWVYPACFIFFLSTNKGTFPTLLVVNWGHVIEYCPIQECPWNALHDVLSCCLLAGRIERLKWLSGGMHGESLKITVPLSALASWMMLGVRVSSPKPLCSPDMLEWVVSKK